MAMLTQHCKIPVGTWAKHPKFERTEVYMREQMVAVVEPFTLALLTRILGWSNESTGVLMAKVRNEFEMQRAYLGRYRKIRRCTC